MIRLLDFLGFLIEWGYVGVLFFMLSAFLPLRQRLLLRLLAFFASGLLFPVIIYSNDLVNLLGAFIGICVYLAVFHRGHWSQKLTAVLVFYPAIIALNYLMQDFGSRCFFFFSGAPKDPSLGWTKSQLLLSTLFHTLSQIGRASCRERVWLML